MEIEKLRIIVDEREKKSGIPKLLAAIGVKTEIKTLVIGDYIVAPEHDSLFGSNVLSMQ